jgi:hypothetical protein
VLKDLKREITYGDIEIDKEAVFRDVQASFGEFLEWWFEMNTVKELNFRNTFDIEVKLEPIRRFLQKEAPTYFERGYMRRRGQVDLEDMVTDSLFFYPLIGLIYELNKLSPEEIDWLTVKSTFYSQGPDGNGRFSEDRMAKEQRADSMYTLTIEEGDPDTASLAIIDHPAIHSRALYARQSYIDPVCSYTVFPQPGQAGIRVVTPGKVKKQGDHWVVEEKIKIEFY